MKRADILENLKTKKYDLLVIGGGITGAGIALDAVLRGLSVALVEKGDFASGTSSKSTKLIHGGLRYLKQMDFALVQEVGTERAVVHNIAPNLVKPEKMLLPLYQGGTYSKFLTSFGLALYDFLAAVKKTERRVMVSSKEALKLEPLLKAERLKGAGLYYEYRTDDARLTIEIIKTAIDKGADCLNYCEVIDFDYDNEGNLAFVKCSDRDENAEIEVPQTRTAHERTSSRLRRTNDRSVRVISIDAEDASHVSGSYPSKQKYKLDLSSLHEDYEDDENAEIEVREQSEQCSFFVEADKIVNAAGPWVDILRLKQQSEESLKKRLHLTKGVHLVVKRDKFPITQSVYFDETIKGRMIFAIPRAGITYFGTTDTNYSGSLDDIKVEEDDIDYLLAAVNGMFPDVQLKKEDIKSSWAGLRPLIHQEGKSPSELSRKDEIFVSGEGLISIAGGKLTGYRKMAERVVDKVMQKLKDKKLLKIFTKSSTKNLKLNACAFKDEAHLLEFKASLEKFLAVYFPTTKSNGRLAERISSRLRRTNDRSVLLVHEDHEDDENAEIGVPLYTPNAAGDLELSSSEAYADHLLDNYGLNAYRILDYLKNLIIERKDLSRDAAFVLAELSYTIDYEYVRTAQDFWERRSGYLYFDIDKVREYEDLVAAEILSRLLFNNINQKTL
jgi:glycerol-3-phosphate dehydrogenase